ncbi:hypothetical protein [Lutibacter sp. HS1-25]|uniref:hypothetical protein n=1 Tax=Lutibacter sp. HS1-25 TaxID=2485000 RepID=UPI001010A483|nr:hypothetical protein [Lutibacter sp. HS1-25]
MKYTQIIVIKMILIFNIISILVFSCTNSKTQTIEVMEVDEIIINVLNTSTQRGMASVTLEINNMDSIDYYVMDSYKGDLDKRDFPIINIKENDLIVDFKPFYSESVTKYYIENENDEPFITTGDEIGLQKIKPKEKTIITLNFPLNKSQIDKLNIKLYFGKYLENEPLSDEKKVFIPPTKEFYNLFSFKEKLIKIY